MRKLILAALIVAPFAAFAAPEDGEKPRGGPGGGGFMQNLTDEQKACVEAANCPKTERKKGGPDGEPQNRERGEKPELTEEEKAAREAERECTKKAFESCGIEMPERPEGGKPGGKGKPKD
jgi:hypothetical protein